MNTKPYSIGSVLAVGSKPWLRLHELAPDQADWIIDKLLEAIGKGWGYKETAAAIVDALGLKLSDAQCWARTIQMEAYREAALKSMRENADILDGWVWFAQLDNGTCEICKEEHGKFHTLNEIIDTHPNCRCTMLTHVKGDPNPITGEHM